MKVLFARPDRAAALARRFEREVAAAARVGHRGIVEVLDFGTDEASGAMYLVMELLEGAPLRARLADRDALDVVRDLRALLEPLAAAHALEPPIVHRDLKPENVFVTSDGDVKLLDFGIARESGTGTGVTDTGAGIGTAAYMSPEQATDARDVGPSADVWSVGVMLYEAIAGRLPFAAPSRNEIITKILTRAPVPLGEAVPSLPSKLAKLVDRCLAKEAERRPADARALADLLDAALPEAEDVLRTLRPGATSASEPTPLAAAPPPRRGPSPVLLALPIFALAAVAAWALWPDAPRPAPDPAPTDAGAPDASAPPDDPNPFVLDRRRARSRARPSTATSTRRSPASARPRRSAGPRSPSRSRSARSPAPSSPGGSERAIEPRRSPSPSGSPTATRAPPYPATGVAWSLAREYCRSLDADLPTEAQWELAARGAERRPGVAPEGEPAIGPAGERPGDLTPEGVHDMIANAREWTRDLYRADADGEVHGWVTAEERTYRAVRGLPVFSRSNFRPPPAAPLAHRVPLCATGDCPEGTDEILLRGRLPLRPLTPPSRKGTVRASRALVPDRTVRGPSATRSRALSDRAPPRVRPLARPLPSTSASAPVARRKELTVSSRILSISPPPPSRSPRSACGGSQPCPAQQPCPVCPTLTEGGAAPPVATVEEWWHLPGSIHFATGGTEVDARSRLFLEEAVRMMRDRNDVVRVRIEGHTDERGNPAANRALSEQRARSVADLLTGMGVPRDRIEIIGYGSERRIATGDTVEDRAINRRIEFSLLMLRPATSGGR